MLLHVWQKWIALNDLGRIDLPLILFAVILAGLESGGAVSLDDDGLVAFGEDSFLSVFSIHSSEIVLGGGAVFFIIVSFLKCIQQEKAA
jgi:hypothetical protein